MTEPSHIPLDPSLARLESEFKSRALVEQRFHTFYMRSLRENGLALQDALDLWFEQDSQQGYPDHPSHES
jgi:hypothetical protein